MVVKKYRPNEGGPDLYAFLNKAVDLKTLAKIDLKEQPKEKK